MTVGITDIAYTYEVCKCGEPTFPHLVEQLWHVHCLIEWKHDGNGWDVVQEIANMHGSGRGLSSRMRNAANDALRSRVPSPIGDNP
jgi:hypothetical protein